MSAILILFWGIGCHKEALTAEPAQTQIHDTLKDDVAELNAELRFRISYLEGLQSVKKIVPLNPVSDTTFTK